MKMRTMRIILPILVATLVFGYAMPEMMKGGPVAGSDAPAITEGTAAPNVRQAKQGFFMRMRLDNRGVFGRQAYAGSIPRDSLGLEYPIGSNIEHIFGGGMWVGGLLDTARVGTSPQIRAVTTAYEGWSGPLYEMFPGEGDADSIWEASKDQPKPAGWDAYWGGALPYNPISDQDLYCTYADTFPVLSHVPLRLKIIQSSYAWNNPYAEAIIIIEYRIINIGVKSIDSAYVGFFFEADVGPTPVANYWQRNFTGYYPASRTAYVHNPVDRGSTPVGATLLSTSLPLDSLRYSFRWYPGPQSPTPDNVRYQFLSSGIIDPPEFPSLSDTRFLYGFGPFFMKPSTDPNPDTLRIAIAVVSGTSRRIDPRIVMQTNAARALDIYLNQGIQLPAIPPSPPLRVNVGFRRVELDWKWRQGDLTKDPEANWDSTNVVAQRDPLRRMNPPPGYDSTQGGRNFEAYRLWRSEHPSFPDESFTLIKQVDVNASDVARAAGYTGSVDWYPDSLRFEYDTGLEYTFVDSNLVRGKTYVYSVTSVSIPNIAQIEIREGDTTRIVDVPVEPLESGFRENAFALSLPFAVSQEADRVLVVPNPYRSDRDYTLESGGYEGLSSQWSENQRLIKFINLPSHCTIRIFSLSGDLIRTVEHDGGGGVFPRGDANVPLLSESNRALASGVYIFTVESPEFGVQTGKFVIIR